MPLETPLRYAGFANNGPYNSNNGDLASVDSSDTYASCQTHPFLSQADLDQDMQQSNTLDDLDMNNLYINPLEKSSDMVRSQVKKSASGDTALRSLVDSPTDEGFQGFDANDDRGSRVSLNETPLPKHRKTRFQQSIRPKARFECPKTSQDSLNNDERGKKKVRGAFTPGKSLASATKLINQHLFGIQSLSSKGEFLIT